jgi:hypothetical protein
MTVWLSDLVIEKFRIIISDASSASNRGDWYVSGVDISANPSVFQSG